MPQPVISLYEFVVETLEGTSVSLERYRGQLLLIVNVASRCGFAPQYRGLESLYSRYRGRGLAVLGFPCNQFARQEPGSAGDIRDFCSSRYHLTFPLFAKVDVNGPNAHPLYVHLKREKPGLFGSGVIKWNFTKFLVGRDGAVLRRFAPITTPERIEAVIRPLLG